MSETKDATENEAEAEAQAPAASEPSPRAVGEETSGPPAGSDEPPRRKKKKKKKKVEEPLTAAGRPELDPRGFERPRFLLRFPEDSELEGLMKAFEAGDYARVRTEAPKLAERTSRPEVKRAAEELLRRIETDPLIKFLLLLSIGLFTAVVAYVYYVHG